MTPKAWEHVSEHDPSGRPAEAGEGAAALGHARRGASIITAAQLLGQSSRVVTGTLILILLGPELSGVVQWVLVFSLFLDDVMRDVGFGAAMIQQADDPGDDELNSLFWATALIGLLTMGLLLAVGPSLAGAVSGEVGSALRESVTAVEVVGPDLGAMLQLVGVTFFVSALSTMNWAILRRRFAFGRVALLQVVTAVLGGTLPLALFWAGLGAWAVPWGIFATSLVVTGMSFAFSGLRPRASFSWTHVSRHLRFSRDVTAGRVVSFAAANGDRFVVGSLLGNLALGFYGFAFRMVMAPVQLLASVSTELLFPTLSRLQADPSALASAFRRSLVLAATVITVPMVALAISAGPVIDLVSEFRGDDWGPARPLVAILAVVAIPQAIMSVVLPAMVAAGRTSQMFVWSTVTAVAAVASYLLGAQFGLEQVAWAFLGVMLLLFVPHLHVVGRCAGVDVVTLLRDLTPVALAGAVGAGAGVLVGLVIPGGAFVELVVRSSGAAFTMLAVLMLLRHHVLVDIVGLIPGAGWLLARTQRWCDGGPA